MFCEGIEVLPILEKKLTKKEAMTRMFSSQSLKYCLHLYPIMAWEICSDISDMLTLSFTMMVTLISL